MSDVKDNVQHIADTLTAGTDAEWAQEWHKDNCRLWDGAGEETLEEHLEWCDERPSAYDWLEDVLDIEWIISNDRRHVRGARILVAFGGPNIWVNTRNNTVEGYWWGDNFTTSYTDNLGLDDAMEELWSMG